MFRTNVFQRHILSTSCLTAVVILGALTLPGLLTDHGFAAKADTAANKIGAVGAVATNATGQLDGGGASQALAIGSDVFQNQTVRTDTSGLAEIMFTDQSTITVGHGSEVVLDKFVYDPNNEVGQLAVSLSQGAMRFIGGHISKKTPVQVTAPTATLTIRGGIGLFNFPKGQEGLAAFLYGIELKVAGKDGSSQTIRQPGFGVTISTNGAVSEPFRLSEQQLASLRGQLENSSSDPGQAPVDPVLQQFGSKDGVHPDPFMQPDKPDNIVNGMGPGIAPPPPPPPSCSGSSC